MKVHVEHDFADQLLRVLVGQPQPDGSMLLLHSEPSLEVEPAAGKKPAKAKVAGWTLTQTLIPMGAMAPPELPSLRVPVVAARDVALALLKWADGGNTSAGDDVATTREALLVERARVDKLLDAVLKIAVSEPTEMLSFTPEGT